MPYPSHLTAKVLDKMIELNLAIVFSARLRAVSALKVKLNARKLSGDHTAIKDKLNRAEKLLAEFLRKNKEYSSDTPPFVKGKLNSARRRLDELIRDHPKEAEYLGVEPRRIKGLSRVLKFRILGRPVSADPARTEKLMRLSDQARNVLITRSDPIRQKLLGLAGPVEQLYRSYHTTIGELYKEAHFIRGEIYKKTHNIKRSTKNNNLAAKKAEADSQELARLSERIEGVVVKRDELIAIAIAKSQANQQEKVAKAGKRKSVKMGTGPAVVATELTLFEERALTHKRPEWKQYMKEFAALKTEIGREFREQGLYGPLYDMVAAQLNTMFEIAVQDLKAPFKRLHYKYEYSVPIFEQLPNGKRKVLRWERRYPTDILTYTGWNGSGTLGMRMPHGNAFSQQMASIVSGVNTACTLRKVTPADDLTIFGARTKIHLGLDPNPDRVNEHGERIDHTRSSARLRVAQLRIGTNSRKPIYGSALVVCPEESMLADETHVPQVRFHNPDARYRHWSMLTTYEIPKLANSASQAVGELVINPNLEADTFATFRRDQANRFDRWVLRGYPGAIKQHMYNTAPGWICKQAEGFYHLKVLRKNIGPSDARESVSVMDEAKAIREERMFQIAEYFKVTAIILDDLLKKENLVVPGWFVDANCQVETKAGILRAYWHWQAYLKLMYPNRLGEMGAFFTEIRAKTRTFTGIVHDDNLSEEEQQNTWQKAAWELAKSVAAMFKLTQKEARFYTLLTMFHERHKMLEQEAINVEQRALRSRLYSYRCFVNVALDGLGVINITSVPLRLRYLSDKQKATAPATLVKAITEAAEKRGIEVVESTTSLAKAAKA